MQDLTKDTDDILVDLINQSNRTDPNYVPYEYGALQFRNVETMEPGSSRGTSIEVTDMETPNNSDWMTLYYDRVPMDRPLSRKNPTLVWDNNFSTTHDLVDALNDRFGINLQTSDIEDNDIDFDPGNDEFPFTVAINALPSSKIYQGTASIDLIDPDTGLGILTPVGTAIDEISEDFTDGEGHLAGFENQSVTDFVQADNSEIVVNGAITKLDGEVITPDDTDGVYTYAVDLASNEDWALAFSFGLVNVINGEDVAELYNLRMIIETHGNARFDMTLYKEGDDYIFRSQDRTLSIANNVVGPNGLYINNVISLSSFPEAISQESKNSAGAALGNYRVILIAERKSGEAPPVTVELNVVTAVAANVGGMIYQTSETLQLVEDPAEDYALPFTVQFAVTGPAGIPVSLPDQIPVTLELADGMGGVVMLPDPIEAHGIHLDSEGGSFIPSGLGKGIYELQGSIMLDKDNTWDPDTVIELSIGFTDLLGNPRTLLASWTLAAIVVDEEPPVDEGELTMVTPPNIDTFTYVGGTDAQFSWTPATFSAMPTEGQYELYRIANDLSPVLLAGSNIDNSSYSGELPELDDYVPTEEDINLVIRFTVRRYLENSGYQELSGESQVNIVDDGNAGFAWEHASIIEAPFIRNAVAGDFVNIYPGELDGIGAPYLDRLRWTTDDYTGPQTFHDYNRYEFDNQDSYYEQAPAVDTVIRGVLRFNLWGGWSNYYIVTAPFTVTDELPANALVGTPEPDLVGLAPVVGTYANCRATIAIEPGDWSAVDVDRYDIMLYRTPAADEAMALTRTPQDFLAEDYVAHGLAWFQQDNPLWDNEGSYKYFYRAQVFAIDTEGNHIGPFWSSLFNVPAESDVPNLLPMSIYWDAEAKRFAVTEPEFDGPILDNNGEEPSEGFIPDTAIVWAVAGEEQYSDFVPGEAGFYDTLLQPSDVMGTSTLVGSELSARVTVRFRTADGWHYASTTPTPYDIEERLWSDAVSGPVITAFDPSVPSATIADADFGTLPVDHTQDYYATVFCPAEGYGGNGARGEIPILSGYNPAKEYLLLARGVLLNGLDDTVDSVYSNVFSTVDGDLGYLSNPAVCTVRPKILRYVGGTEEAPIIYPGKWNCAGLTLAGQYRFDTGVLELEPPLPDPENNLFMFSDYMTAGEGPCDPGVIMATFVSANTPFNEQGSGPKVRSEGYAALTTLEGASIDVPTLDAPTLTAITDYNRFTLSGGEDLGALVADEIYLIFAAKFLYDGSGDSVFHVQSAVKYNPAGGGSWDGNAQLSSADLIDTVTENTYKVAYVARHSDGSFSFSDWSAPFTVIGTL